MRAPIARRRVTIDELGFFTKVVLEFNAGHYARKKVENGKLGDLLVEWLDREEALEAEQEQIRALNGRSKAKPRRGSARRHPRRRPGTRRQPEADPHRRPAHDRLEGRAANRIARA